MLLVVMSLLEKEVISIGRRILVVEVLSLGWIPRMEGITCKVHLNISRHNVRNIVH